MKKSNFTNLLFIIIFNFNTIGLPIGVMWSNLFSLGMFIWLLLKKKIIYVLLPVVLLISYMLAQYFTIKISNTTSYLLSSAYFFTSALVGIYFYIFLSLKTYSSNKIESQFMTIINVNIFLTLMATILYFTPFKEYLWIVSKNINSYGEIRLQLFFYEPSHLGYISIFFMLYLFLNILFYSQKKYLIPFVFTSILVILTKSLGTMGSMAIAFALAALVFFLPLIKKFYKKIIFFLLASLLIFPLMSDDLMHRIDKVIEGEDNSGNIRLIYATQAAYSMVEKYNYYFGVGFGQTKEYILEFTSEIAGYGADRLPNSFASSLATVGVVGMVLKFLFLIYFFIKTHVYQNIFRLTTFFYVLIYGFSGGWMLNVYEFILWAFAFSPVFSKFDKKIIFQRIKTR